MMEHPRKNALATIVAGLVVFLSGASALSYEILWQRELLLVFGASTRPPPRC